METAVKQFGNNLEELEASYIDKEYILNYVSEEDIFSLVFGFIPEEHQYVTSPFREDKNPNCWFEFYDGKLRFVDFANHSIINGVRMNNIDCFNAVKVFYGLPNFYQVLDFIQEKLIKGKDVVEKSVKKQVINNTPNKNSTNIFFKSRSFNNFDKKFWGSYYITKKNLIEDKVFAVESFNIVNNDSLTYTPYDICYCYTDFENNHKKIYRPYNKKRFLTNCTKNDIGNIKNLIPYERLYITKSYKDCRVLRNLNLNCIWFQNEGMIPEDDVLLPVLNKVNDIVIWFDNDEAGLSAGKIVNDKILKLGKKTKNIHLPISLLNEGIKDPSDLIKYRGVNDIIEFLKSKKLW